MLQKEVLINFNGMSTALEVMELLSLYVHFDFFVLLLL